jgi:hypothetical protein
MGRLFEIVPLGILLYMMNLKFLTHKEATLFILFGLTIILLGWLFFILALFNFFVFPVVFLGGLFLGGTVLFFLSRLLLFTTPLVRLAFGLFFIIVSINGYFTSPTLFSGRDQGAISEAAIRLAQTSILPFKSVAVTSFFDIYGPGLALNFPGFAYTEGGSLISQFPLAYTSFIAGFYSVFGVTGLVLANSLLLFCFLVTLFELLRLFITPSRALIATLAGALSFLPLYFSQFTLTENLAVFLFTFLVYSLIRFIQKPSFLHYITAITTGSLLMFTRIEGYALFVLAFIILLWNKDARTMFRTYPWKTIFFPTLVILFFFLRNFFINLPYYKTIGRALEKLLGGFGSDVISNTSSNLGILAGHFPVGGVLILYGVLPLFIAGILGYLILWRSKEHLTFIPLLIALPTLLYLFLPNITLDHPWMLRRYYFTLFPLFLFGAAVGLSRLADTTRQGRTLFLGIFVLLFTFSLPAHFSVSSVREDASLLPQVERFSTGFAAQSLILIDRAVTGSGYALPTAPLVNFYDRQAVYIFNPEDITKLDITRFSQVYLLTPESELYRYAPILQDRLIYKGSYTFNRTGLTEATLRQNGDFSFPEKKLFETKNLLFQVY